jgi:hypothetical protein
MTDTPTPEAMIEARVWLVQPSDGSRDNSDTPRLALLFDRFRAQIRSNTADLTERARASLLSQQTEELVRAIQHWIREEPQEVIYIKAREYLAATLQSERESERAEARRAAAQWHGHRYSEFQDQLLHKDMNKVTRARIEGQMLAHNESAKHFGALASPTPQEETRC